MIKGAIFDVDGTLLDSMAIWEEAGERYLERLHIKAEPAIKQYSFSYEFGRRSVLSKRNI